MLVNHARSSTDGSSIRLERGALIGDSTLIGSKLAAALCAQVDRTLVGLAEQLPKEWSLLAVGGYGHGLLCPGSDVDVVLVHPSGASDDNVGEVAAALWYPLWDAGVRLSPSAHTRTSLLELAGDDLATATAVLRIRNVVGDPMVASSIQDDAVEQWHGASARWLRLLRAATEARWARSGDVASLLEPDLKDGRGGLRDVHALRWAVAVDRADVLSALDAPIDGLRAPYEVLLAARCEVHRTTGRANDTLLLQDQDHVAATLGFPDADDYMLHLASAARSVDWVAERFWRRIGRLVRVEGSRGPGRRSARPVSLPDPVPGVSVVDDEVRVSSEADLGDPALVFRAAASAAHAGLPLAASALRVLCGTPLEPAEPWSDRTRRGLLSLLGAGQGVVAAVEALEQYGLFSRFLPEWAAVRSRPQRNAFHIYTVDRHLLQTVANAADLVRRVSRPDLLLIGALLHDIGKGHPGDHTAAGVALVDEVCPRLGFSREDTAIIRTLVELHLLLPETATRRDLSDPRTAANVADQVGDLGTLELLHALTEADSRATGPSAWSTWKASLIDRLVGSVEDRLRGLHVRESPAVPDGRLHELAARVEADEGLHLTRDRIGDFDVLRIASRDRRGLFSAIAGTLALHGLDVASAEAFTTNDGIAIDEFHVVHPAGGTPDWNRIDRDLRKVAAGTLDLAERLQQRIRTYARARPRATSAARPRLEVLVTNDASDSTTMIDVRAPDGLAVLYRLSATLAAEGVDIRSAKVATLGHEVVDVFYVQTVPSGETADHTTARAGQLAPSDHDRLADLLKAALTPH